MLLLILKLDAVSISAETIPQFSDMPNNWSTQALISAVDNGLLQGNEGKIMPDGIVTRAQAAAVINRAFSSYILADIVKYSDVPKTAWYSSEMAKAVQMKTFQGSGTLLDPNGAITREQLFVVIARAFKIEGPQIVPQGFSDLDKISPWALTEVYSLINEGYIIGNDGRIDPKNTVTRAELAQIMYNMIKKYFSIPGEYTEVPEGNIVINSSGVTLKDVEVSGDLIIGDGVGDASVILNNVVVTGRLLIRGGGDDSIFITGSSKIDKIVVSRTDGKVHVTADEGIIINNITADGCRDISLTGDFLDLLVLTPDITVFLNSAQIGHIAFSAKNTHLICDEGSIIEEISINAADVDIDGLGSIKDIIIEADGDNAVILVPFARIDIKQGALGVKGIQSRSLSQNSICINDLAMFLSPSEKISYFNGLWFDFALTINDQAVISDPPDRVTVIYDNITKIVNLKIREDYHKEEFMQIAFGTGLKTAILDLLESEKVTKLTSLDKVIETTDIYGTKKPTSDIENSTLEIMFSWIGGNLSLPMNEYLIGKMIDITLYELYNGEEFFRTYHIYFN